MSEPADAVSGAEPQEQPARSALFQELGTAGLKRSGGTVIEEFLPQLAGVRGRKVYAEMATDPLIGGTLLAITEVIGRLAWEFVAPEGATPEEEEQAQFTQECLEDMSESWDVTLSQLLSMVTFGWSYHETVYKERLGRNPDPSKRSRFNDGRLGWRKFAIRSQDTLAEWVLDQAGGIRGLIQNDQYSGGRKEIPIERALLFRTSEYKGNPEGRSMLRGAFVPWYFKKRIQELEAIGVERDLAGMPVGSAPLEWFETPNDNRLSALRDTVRDIRRNESDGVLLPMVYDENGHPLVKLELMSSGGARQFDTSAIIGRYNNDVATSMLMDFITLGHENVGSYALGTAKITMWQLVVESIAKSIASVVNKHAVPRLMRLNGWQPDRMPELVFGDVAAADLSILSTYLKDMIAAGVIVPDETLEGYIRDIGNLPPASTREVGALPGAAEVKPEMAAEEVQTRVNAAATLIRSGFDPEAALILVGLDPIKHLGLLPVTVQRPEEPANPDSQAAADLGVPIQPQTDIPATPPAEPAPAAAVEPVQPLEPEVGPGGPVAPQ